MFDTLAISFFPHIDVIHLMTRPNFSFHIAQSPMKSMSSFRKNISFHEPRMFSHECISTRSFTFPESWRETATTNKTCFMTWHTFPISFKKVYIHLDGSKRSLILRIFCEKTDIKKSDLFHCKGDIFLYLTLKFY